MSLDQKDVDLLERIIYKNADDIAVSIARSFERLEERIDAVESRMHARVADAEDKIETARQELSGEISQVMAELREIAREIAGKKPNDL